MKMLNLLLCILCILQISFAILSLMKTSSDLAQDINDAKIDVSQQIIAKIKQKDGNFQ